MNSKVASLLMFFLLLLPFSNYAAADIVSVDVNGQKYIIGINAEGIEVQSIEGDGDLSLILTVDSTGSSGTLEITFDRELFDSTYQGEDDSFFVILDGFDEATFTETKTDSTRSLLIDIPLGTEEIEIIGSHILDGTFGIIQSGTKPVVTEPPAVTTPPAVTEPPAVTTPPAVTEPPGVPEVPKVTEKESTQCGPGTVLKNGECVLDETCGKGTHLENGVCVLDKPGSSSSAERPPMSQLIYGAAAALVISFIVIIFFWIISRGNREQK